MTQTLGHVPKRIASIMWKTVSESCNLACDYCYYSTCQGRVAKLTTIDDDILEKCIKEYMEINRGLATFVWQGGEPLMAGLDFFQRVIHIQKKFRSKYSQATNAVQTNGTLINRNWARFFAKERFLVGVSIDGPEELNQRRVTRSGRASFDLTMRGIEYLREQHVDFNILTVIHEGNVNQAEALMSFYQKQGFPYIQLIPCMDFQAQQIDQPGMFTITPEQYGDFLCQAFDYWYNDGQPQQSIRIFDNLLAVYLNQTAEHCIHLENCPTTIILESNGDAYPCDFYMDKSFCLGNIKVNTLAELIQHPHMNKFASLKANLPEQCHSCEFLKFCHGGCPRNRLDASKDQQTEYFCQSYQQLYRYADKRMKQLAMQMKRDKLLALVASGYPLPANTEPCLCGSSQSFEDCCQTLIGQVLTK
ncbi:anaerobic sulfatase maturase [Amphibacillus sediminis]|uniref:anaerobic sulfatase maturase n=1 Tax=Amphibacillus sediminis TaxID=360185 RepID=UPI0012EEBE26|nr:anaerobic sulfatase maturase [Amphibacillus sediminis]